MRRVGERQQWVEWRSTSGSKWNTIRREKRCFGKLGAMIPSDGLMVNWELMRMRLLRFFADRN
jgi:hypothetical protein